MKEITYRPCKPEHIALIRPQDHDKPAIAGYLTPASRAMMENSFAISAWVDNRCVGAAGIVHCHGVTALAWAVLGADAGPYLTQLTRRVRNAIDISPYKRIEMRVLYDFEEGHRWAKLLGFGEPDAPLMRCSSVYGQDETLYARVK